MNDNGIHIGITIFLCILALAIGTLYGASTIGNYYQKEAIKRGFGYYETSIDKDVTFFWRTNIIQKP